MKAPAKQPYSWKQIVRFGVASDVHLGNRVTNHVTRLRARAPIAVDDTALPADELGLRAEQREQLLIDTVFAHSNISGVN